MGATSKHLFPLHEAHILCKLNGLIGPLKGQLKLRKRALKLLEPELEERLYRILFITYSREYFDEIQRVRKTSLFDAFIRYEA